MNPEARKIVPEQKAEKIPDFNERVSQKSEKLEQTKQAFEKGDTSSISPEEIQNLKSKLPGFIKMIKGRMQDIQNETNGPNSTEANKKIESLQRLLAASETMQQYFESQNSQQGEIKNVTQEQVTSIIDDKERQNNVKPTSEEREDTKEVQNQAESTRNTVDSTREKLEKFKNIQEIMSELVKKTQKLNELLLEVEKGEADIDKKKEAEAEIEKILKDIEDLLEQLKEQPDDVNPEETEKMNQLDSEITRLQEEINSNPNSSEAQAKKDQIVKLSSEYQNYQNSKASSFKTAQEIVSTFSIIKQTEKSNLNEALKSRVEEVMTNSGTNFGEKFRNIEKNQSQKKVQ